MTKIIIADDIRLLRESLKYIIETNSSMKVVACAKNGLEAYEYCNIHQPDVVLMDLTMPQSNGTEATKSIKLKYPDIKIIILTSSEDEINVVQALHSGADGYLLKNIGAEELIHSIKSVLLGFEIIHKEVFKHMLIHPEPTLGKEPTKALTVGGIDIELNEREVKIIQMIVEGKDNKNIGSELFIAEGTVKNAISAIINKLQLKDRTQLAVFALKNNLVD